MIFILLFSCCIVKVANFCIDKIAKNNFNRQIQVVVRNGRDAFVPVIFQRTFSGAAICRPFGSHVL
ncbi:hypothetical protein CHU92_13205, partial [Flavobacterium cyanobacteriorum]